MNPLKRASRAWTAGTLVAMALALVFSACSSGSSTPAGWTRTSVTTDGYTIDTPKDWTAVANGGQEIDTLITQMRSSDPEVAGMLQKARDSGQSFVALATDKTLIGDTGFTPNINVAIAPSRGNDSASTAATALIALKNLSIGGEVEDTAVALPADPGAHRLRYRLAFTGRTPLVVTLYLITHSGKTYNLVAGAVDSQLAGLEDTFLTIARSVTFVGS